MNPIVGIGEVLWDVYPDNRKVAGGAPFNFAFHCHQLGHPAVIVSRVGDDDLGRELRERVRELGLSDIYIQTDPKHPTGTVQVTLDANKVPTYTITKNVAWDYIEMTAPLMELVLKCQAICYGSLAQRRDKTRQTITRFLYETAQSTERVLNVCDLNLRAPHYEADWLERVIFACDWLKLNDSEMETIRRLFTQGHKYPQDHGDRKPLEEWFFDQPDRNVPRAILVTRGDAGAEIRTRKQTFDEPGVPAKVVDTVGAGDAFTAAMVCLHLEGKPLRECERFANHYAARVCEQPGGTPRIDRAEVERAAFGK
jgi:fructokinase